MGDGSTHVLGLSPMNFAVVAIIISSTGLLIYHFIVVLWCNPRRDNITQQQVVRNSLGDIEDDRAVPESSENSIASLIPACKYSIEIGLVSKSEDVTCAVCLNEFRDGEAVKVLPECLHTFHVSCIDIWLNSHNNCPVCRADTVSWTALRCPREMVVAGRPGSLAMLGEGGGLERTSYPASHGILVANAVM